MLETIALPPVLLYTTTPALLFRLWLSGSVAISDRFYPMPVEGWRGEVLTGSGAFLPISSRILLFHAADRAAGVIDYPGDFFLTEAIPHPSLTDIEEISWANTFGSLRFSFSNSERPVALVT